MSSGKPIVLVDMDGPLADFDAHFWRRCLDRGFQFDCLPEQQSRRFATDHLIHRSERAAAREMVDSDPHWFQKLPVVDGAIEGINTLTDVADVWICTKPLEANYFCRDGKATWVRYHLGSDWERRLIIAPDKSKVHGAVLLDDAIHPDWVGSATWEPVVFPMNWNGEGSKWERWPRWTWGDAPEQLVEYGSPF